MNEEDKKEFTQEVIRYLVLNRSLEIEDLLSKIIMYLLGIENEPDNKSLGFKGSALSLKAKVDLLFDINKIKKELRNDLILFMEIRNQFIHNLDSNTFDVVVKRISKEKKLLGKFEENKKLPNHENLSLENKYRVAFIGLTKSILEDLRKVKIEIIKERIARYKDEKNRGSLEFYKESIIHLDNTIHEMVGIINNHLKNEFGDDKKLGEHFMLKFSQILKLKIDIKIDKEEN